MVHPIQEAKKSESAARDMGQPPANTTLPQADTDRSLTSQPVLLVDDIWVLLVLFCRHAHLSSEIIPAQTMQRIETSHARVSIYSQLRADAETYLFERVQSCQNGPADPRRVLPLRRRVDFDLDVLEREFLNLVEEARAVTWRAEQ